MQAQTIWKQKTPMYSFWSKESGSDSSTFTDLGQNLNFEQRTP